MELDAIDPPMLRQLVRSALEVHMPSEQLRILQAAEQSERDIFTRLAHGFRLRKAGHPI